MRVRTFESKSLLHKFARLQHLTARVTQADRHKDALMMMVAHELRGPLSPLLCSAAALAQSKDPVAHKIGTLIERQVGQLSRIVDDLHAGSTGSSAPFAMEFQPVCMRDVIEDALTNTQAALDAKQQLIRLSWGSGTARVEGDRQRLTQVISNVLSNAIKFSPAQDTIEIVEWVQGGYEVIEVIDNGPGIALPRRAEVFELFSRGDQAATAVPGLGIGLWLARNFVERHGGTLTAHAAPSGGALMRIRLPTA